MKGETLMNCPLCGKEMRRGQAAYVPTRPPFRYAMLCYAVCYPIGVIPVDTLTDLYSLNFVVLFSVLKDFILNV